MMSFSDRQNLAVTLKYGIFFLFLVIPGLLEAQLESEERIFLASPQRESVLLLQNAAQNMAHQNWYPAIENYQKIIQNFPEEIHAFSSTQRLWDVYRLEQALRDFLGKQYEFQKNEKKSEYPEQYLPEIFERYKIFLSYNQLLSFEKIYLVGGFAELQAHLESKSPYSV